MTTQQYDSDNFVERAMRIVHDSNDAAWDAGKGEEYGARYTAPEIDRRDSKLAELRAHLQHREEEFEKLQRQAEKLAEALKDLFGADMEHVLMGDGKEDQIQAIAKARAALAEWERK
jgi:hypothetical protein